MAGMWESLTWALRAAAVVVGHFVVVFLIIVLIWLGEQLLHLLWVDTEPMLFDVVPIKYLFQAIDLTLIIVFLYNGALAAHREMSRR